MISTSFSLEILNKSSANTLSEVLGIEYTEINSDFLKARMPVNNSTCQQLGMLHGGASAALCETVGSMAAYLSIDRNEFYCVGLEMKINHIKPMLGGYVYATATVLHYGIKTHVWQIRNEDEKGNLVSFATLTLAILSLDQRVRDSINSKF